MFKTELRNIYRELREIYRLCTGKSKDLGYILMMHHVLPQDDPCMPKDRSLNITPGALDKFLSEASKNFEFIPLTSVPNRIAYPTGKKFIALTFDDGFESVYKYAYPLLKRYNAPFTAFISTGFVGKPCDTYKPVSKVEKGMSVEQLTELRDDPLVTIGGHTVTHRRLAHIPVEQMKQEINDNILQLRELLGIEINTFAYPYGDQNEEVVKIMSSSDNKIEICVLASGNSLTQQDKDNYLLPRVNLDDTVTARERLHWRNRYMGL